MWSGSKRREFVWFCFVLLSFKIRLGFRFKGSIRLGLRFRWFKDRFVIEIRGPEEELLIFLLTLVGLFGGWFLELVLRLLIGLVLVWWERGLSRRVDLLLLFGLVEGLGLVRRTNWVHLQRFRFRIFESESNEVR